MKNKNQQKIQYMFGEKDEDKAGFSLGGLKNLIMENYDIKEEKMTSKDLEEIKNMKENLFSFSYTNIGICNALIFLGEKNNINDEYENYNFNPWKAEWIYTPEYKKKRKQMIHNIRSSMDYRGEISDDEDSIIKYDDKRDYINERIKQMNDQILKKRHSVRTKPSQKAEEDNKPMINNSELVTGEVNKSLVKNSLRSNISQNSKAKNSISESNQRLNIKSVISNSQKTNNSYNNINNTINNSEFKVLTDRNLFPKNGNEK
jgi:hypothetical protein